MKSRFHISLTVVLVLALLLGFVTSLTLQPHIAEGYPGGSVVSTGSNPVVARGGYMVAGSTVSSLTAPSDQAIIITDVVLTMHGYDGSSPCLKRVTFDTSEGSIAEYRIASDTDYSYGIFPPTTISHSYSSGLPLQAGDTLVLTHHSGGGSCEVSYSISGYYAQP